VSTFIHIYARNTDSNTKHDDITYIIVDITVSIPTKVYYYHQVALTLDMLLNSSSRLTLQTLHRFTIHSSQYLHHAMNNLL